jgi:hypothetical protein
MGIRFNCPHCRRALNVKAAQAGLEGLCPYCRGIVTIMADPGLSMASENSLSDQLNEIENEDDQITHEGLLNKSQDESESLLTDLPIPETSGPSKTSRRFRMSPEEEIKSAFMLDKPASISIVEASDPISEAPHLIWYYRAKNQKERGPLKAKLIREELEVGNILPGSLVWREDWETWKPAESVFEQLQSITTDSKYFEVNGRVKRAVSLALDVHTIKQIFRQRPALLLAAVVAGLLFFALFFGTLYVLFQYLVGAHA